MILREVRRRAGNPTKAVITVPAYFDDSPAAGHPRRRPDRRAGRAADRQRADRRGPRLRPRPAQAPAPSPSTTSAAARSTARSCRIADGVFKVLSHQRRHLPRRRRLRPGADGRSPRREMGIDLGRRRTRNCSSTSATRPSGRRSPCRDGRVGRTFARDCPAPDRGSTTAARSRGPNSKTLIGPLIDRTLDKCRSRPPRRRADAGADRRGRAGRRLDAHPVRPPAGRRVLRPDAAHRAEPGRGGRPRGGGAGRHPHRRPARHAAARRRAAVARHRDARRRRGQGDPPQQHRAGPGDRPGTPRSSTTRPRSTSTSTRASAS